ncbi:MAG: hypothetical protein GKR90_08600 [Pseudomonadales bacterium]|nr:hypothetical protein [Pseudomonadales bacterium]
MRDWREMGYTDREVAEALRRVVHFTQQTIQSFSVGFALEDELTWPSELLAHSVSGCVTKIVTKANHAGIPFHQRHISLIKEHEVHTFSDRDNTQRRERMLLLWKC